MTRKLVWLAPVLVLTGCSSNSQTPDSTIAGFNPTNPETTMSRPTTTVVTSTAVPASTSTSSTSTSVTTTSMAATTSTVAPTTTRPPATTSTVATTTAVTTTTTTVPATTTTAAPKIYVVEMTDQPDFVPSPLTVNAGDSVRWKNVGIVQHTATGAGWDTGLVNPGSTSGTITFSQPGTSDYVCSIHANMGTIVVNP